MIGCSENNDVEVNRHCLLSVTYSALSVAEKNYEKSQDNVSLGRYLNFGHPK